VILAYGWAETSLVARDTVMEIRVERMVILAQKMEMGGLGLSWLVVFYVAHPNVDGGSVLGDEVMVAEH
jgi:hypothetical protein